MKASLQARCEAQVRNEAELRKGHMLEYEAITKLGAMLYANAGVEVDRDRLAECKAILKSKVGLFSNFRGHMQYLVQMKMALADDPEAYLDDVLEVYELLKQDLMLAGEMVAMTATTICENCPPERRVAVAETTREAYAQVKARHRILTGEDDMALIALLVISGLDTDETVERSEEILASLKGHFLPTSDVPQSVALVLALSDKPTEQKIHDFFALYDACKAAGHATGKDKAMTIYATYADLDADRAEVVADIGEVDAWLKGQKGYGAFGVGSSVRRLFAAMFVLEDRQETNAALHAGTSSAVAQAVVEELLLVLISIIVTTAVINASTSSSH